MSQRLKHDLRSKQQEFESAVRGSQDTRQALLQSESEVRKLQEYVQHLNLMQSKSGAEIERYRQQVDEIRTEANLQESQLRRELDEAVKAAKSNTKAKYRAQMERLEAVGHENLQLRAQEVERNIRELCRREQEIQAEKFELRLKSSYIEIGEHESIIRQIQAREREQQKAIYDEA